MPAVPSKMAESGELLLHVAASYGPPLVVPQTWLVVFQVPVPDHIEIGGG